MKRFAAMLAFLLPFTAFAGIEEGVQAYTSGDYAKAIAEFKPLAEGGNENAQYYMGFLHHHGYGVKRNEAEASKWFLMGANQNEPQSQYYLGVIYEKGGQGLQADLPTAHMWLTLSATNSRTSFRDMLHTKEAIKKLELKMKPEQIEKAKEMAKSWKPQG